MKSNTNIWWLAYYAYFGDRIYSAENIYIPLHSFAVGELDS